MTNAEKQRRYRERKKLVQGSEYLKREAERVRKYYVATTELSQKELDCRRKKIRDSLKKHRSSKSKTDKNDKNNTDAGPRNSNTADHETINNKPKLSKIMVKMNFQKHRLKFDSKLQNANKKIRVLQEKVRDVQRENNFLKKEIQRLKIANQRSEKHSSG